MTTHNYTQNYRAKVLFPLDMDSLDHMGQKSWKVSISAKTLNDYLIRTLISQWVLLVVIHKERKETSECLPMLIQVDLGHKSDVRNQTHDKENINNNLK